MKNILDKERDKEIIIVGIGEAAVTNTRQTLMTIGLGSCVGVVIYDKLNNVAGLIHVLLPSSDGVRKPKEVYKYADIGIPKLVDELVKHGAKKKNLIAKIAGGASMFKVNDGNINNIGLKNVCAVKGALRIENIPIMAEDTGGEKGRTMILKGDNFEVTLKYAGEYERGL